MHFRIRRRLFFYVRATDLIKTLSSIQKRRIPTLTLSQQANEHLKYIRVEKSLYAQFITYYFARQMMA